jgi:hypothetical protein
MESALRRESESMLIFSLIGPSSFPPESCASTWKSQFYLSIGAGVFDLGQLIGFERWLVADQ